MRVFGNSEIPRDLMERENVMRFRTSFASLISYSEGRGFDFYFSVDRMALKSSKKKCGDKRHSLRHF
ncbi:MAG: hypothetical protein R3321_09385 [Nitrososphaeraceae archaeon]|nr:hypothetical protein [Nitrososphaeraceae archaeon]